MNDSGTTYSVSEITRQIRELLEGEYQSIWVEGEISNYKHHTSGHRYFTLKDESAQLKAVIWRFNAQSLKLDPKDGLQVRAFGDITLYEKGGYYQLRVIRMEPLGLGSLEERFRRLKEKLEAEGLFDPAHKKPIPRFPATIGLVTSATGAAIRDMVHVARRRAPMVRLVVRPTAVQGDAAAPDIARAIEEFNRWGEADLLIVGRGGGSLEDLWAFNEEVVARAIYDSRIPIISAIGHETDFSISDFVADLRAPTPSAAAEVATYDAASYRALLQELTIRIRNALQRNTALRRERLERLVRSRWLRSPQVLLEAPAQRLDDLSSRLARAAGQLLKDRRSRFSLLAEKLAVLSPQSVLKRGFAVVRGVDDGGIVKSVSALTEGSAIEVEFADGSVAASVERIIPKQGE